MNDDDKAEVVENALYRLKERPGANVRAIDDFMGGVGGDVLADLYDLIRDYDGGPPPALDTRLTRLLSYATALRDDLRAARVVATGNRKGRFRYQADRLELALIELRKAIAR